MLNVTTELESFKKLARLEASDEKLLPVLLDVTRVLDKKITLEISKFKIENNLKITSLQKNAIRQYLLGLDEWPLAPYKEIERNFITPEDEMEAIRLAAVGLTRNAEMLLGTVQSRLRGSNSQPVETKKYADYIREKESGQAQLILLEIDSSDELSTEQICANLESVYDDLANYHFLAITMHGLGWEQIADIALFAESFRTESSFKLFERTKKNKVAELISFVESNPNLNVNDEVIAGVEKFYEKLAYGFVFQDLFISENTDTKILIFQKIELDETDLPCPDCMETIVRGNSYPRLLLKSFECHNPRCPSRSKIGRGKRYDLFNVKRNLKLKAAVASDQVDETIRKSFRRDIFESNLPVQKALIELYSWPNDNILHISQDKNISIPNAKRKIDRRYFNRDILKNTSTPLELLLRTIVGYKSISPLQPAQKYKDPLYSLYQGDSTRVVGQISENIDNAVTSPPYYNAREYSQWPTLVCYLIDMALSAISVYEKLEPGGKYFYNIGDIVGQDNVYISSHMSNRRLMLGFLSVLVFRIAGYSIDGNIIWDKGEVQSKRNSTDNPFPTYLKPINCYEHIWIFGKQTSRLELPNIVQRIDPVRKINSKGENILGHTAPYPEELVQLALRHMGTPVGTVLDPFVGSGTTVITCAKNSVKSVGIEFDPTYFKLANQRIQTNIKEFLNRL